MSYIWISTNKISSDIGKEEWGVVKGEGEGTMKLLLVLITDTLVAEDPRVRAAVNMPHIYSSLSAFSSPVITK